MAGNLNAHPRLMQLICAKWNKPGFMPAFGCTFDNGIRIIMSAANNNGYFLMLRDDLCTVLPLLHQCVFTA